MLLVGPMLIAAGVLRIDTLMKLHANRVNLQFAENFADAVKLVD